MMPAPGIAPGSGDPEPGLSDVSQTRKLERPRAHAAMSSPPVNQATSTTRSAYVLVAEDDGPLNELLAETLREGGYRVLQAFDGVQAYELARATLPTLILLDLELPQVYGQVVLRALKNDPRTAD